MSAIFVPDNMETQCPVSGHLRLSVSEKNQSKLKLNLLW